MNKHRRKKALNANINTIPNSIISHILGYIGFESSQFREVCHRFNDCPLLMPNVAFPSWNQNTQKVIENFDNLIIKKMVTKITFSNCKQIRLFGTFERMESIITLNINGENVSDDIMKIISTIKNLRFLSLKSCTNVVDEGIAHLACGILEQLDVSFCNNIRGTTLYMLKNLVGLNLWGCRKIDVGCVENIVNLRSLKICCDNDFANSRVGKLVNLRELELRSYGQMCAENVFGLVNLVNLERMMMHMWCNGFDFFKGKMKLRDLFIFACKLTMDDWNVLVRECRELESLCLIGLHDSFGLTHEVSLTLARGLKNLKHLEIFSCSGTDLANFQDLRNTLESLCINYVHKLNEISNFVNLKFLKIGSTRLNGEVVKEILNLNKLKELNIHGVSITKENFNALKTFMKMGEFETSKICLSSAQ